METRTLDPSLSLRACPALDAGGDNRKPPVLEGQRLTFLPLKWFEVLSFVQLGGPRLTEGSTVFDSVVYL